MSLAGSESFPVSDLFLDENGGSGGRDGGMVGRVPP